MVTKLLCILLLVSGTVSVQDIKTYEYNVPVSYSIDSEYEASTAPIRVPIFPTTVTLYEGQEALIRMTQKFNMTSCNVMHISNRTTVVLLPPEQNQGYPGLQYLGGGVDSGECGVRISNVNEAHVGSWNLTLLNNNIHVAVGLFHLNVEKSIPDSEMSYETAYITENYTLSLGLSEENSMYCSVKHPSQGILPTLYGQDCEISLVKSSPADSGIWESLLGVEGMTEEVLYRKSFRVWDNVLDAGCENSTTSYPGAMNLYCNVPYAYSPPATLIPTYCRFVRPGDGAGLNMMDGLGNGKYSYYGAGVEANECGLTIESPEAVDIGVWQCILGNNIHYVASLIPLYLPDHNNCQLNQQQELTLDTEEQDMDVLIGSMMSVMCSTSTSLQYCIILSPDDKSYTGEVAPLGLGKCIVKIFPVTLVHSGAWTCVMGDMNGGGEFNTTVNVRVRSSHLVSVKNSITANFGKETVLSCQSMSESNTQETTSAYVTPTKASLAYCRFIRPDGIIISLNESGVLVQDRYKYYGKGLASGDCGINIQFINFEDEGRWRCASRIHGRHMESWDFINLKIDGSTEVFPSTVTVQKGEEVVLKLKGQYPNQHKCSIKMPNGIVVDLSSPGSYPVSYWGMGVSEGYCGIKIKGEALQVPTDGYEMWTLISMGPEAVITSAIAWVAVTDLNARSVIKSDHVTLFVDLGGSIDLQCNRTGSQYCIIVPPGGNQEHYAPSSCTKTLDPIISIDLGVWTCYIGVSMTIREIVQTVELIARDTKISSGWKSSQLSPTSVELLCNIDFPLEYCRFVGPSGVGVRLSLGLVTGRYSYMGKGLENGDCGMTIVDTQEDDYGTWMCFVGVRKDDDIDHQAGYITITKRKMRKGDDTLPYSSASEEVLAIVGSELTITCEAKASLTYCWFHHPNGTQFVPVLEKDGDAFHYSGVGLQMGVCGITIKEAQFEDSGQWKCHMGIKTEVMSEIVKTLTVIITRTALHAVNSSIEPSSDNSTVVSCQTVPVNTDLAYCRFVRPDGKGFSLNQRMNGEVLDRYRYYGEGLTSGHCGVQILEVHSEDYGEWICAALPHGGSKESLDYITVQRSVAVSQSIIWMIIGVALVILLAGTVLTVLCMKRSRIQQEQQSQPRASATLSQACIAEFDTN